MTQPPTVTTPTPIQSLRTAPAVILLCPGQGAQTVGMGKAWADKYPAARETFQQADDLLGFKLSDLCWNGPEEELIRTDNAQPAIYTTTVACYRALASEGRFPKVAAAAGLSLGEFTALHLAGAFDFETGLKLVRLRGQAMQEAASSVASGMVALIGSDEAQARLLCQEAIQGDEVLVPANYNCPGQIVLSGHLTACERSLKRAADMGIKARAAQGGRGVSFPDHETCRRPFERGSGSGSVELAGCTCHGQRHRYLSRNQQN